MQFANSFTPS